MRELSIGLVMTLAVGCASSPPPPPPPDAAPQQVSSPEPATAEPPPAPSEPAPEPVAVAPQPETQPEPEPVPEPEPEPEPAVAGVPGANLTMGSLSADGLELKDVSCKADGLGFLGAIVVAGSVAKKKAALKACASGKSPRVSWTFAGGKITDVTVEGGDAKIGACVSRALKNAAAPGTGNCAATLVL